LLVGSAVLPRDLQVFLGGRRSSFLVVLFSICVVVAVALVASLAPFYERLQSVRSSGVGIRRSV
jgi:hypothetical protein